ncbi:MAG: hypothetical protein MMC33_005132 [Icmadophila ericetorum]|nr:hypothetical protein [Icmadophila ericetorum]
MDATQIIEIVFGALGAFTTITRLFTYLFEYFEKLKDYRIMRYFRHLHDLMETYNKLHTFSPAPILHGEISSNKKEMSQ